MVNYTKPIAESNKFIVLDRYTNEWQVKGNYQSEYDYAGAWERGMAVTLERGNE